MKIARIDHLWRRQPRSQCVALRIVRGGRSLQAGVAMWPRRIVGLQPPHSRPAECADERARTTFAAAMTTAHDVIVIGAGVIGTSIAYHLAALGARDVVVLDRGRIGAGTSSQSSGILRTHSSV